MCYLLGKEKQNQKKSNPEAFSPLDAAHALALLSPLPLHELTVVGRVWGGGYSMKWDPHMLCFWD